MKANKIGLVNNNGDYELVNTDLFPYDDDSNEECKNNLICDDLLGVLKVHKFLLEHDYSTLPRKDFDDLFRKLMALEIIKKKGIDIDIFIWSNNCGEYNTSARVGIGLTQEEYELLVGILL